MHLKSILPAATAALLLWPVPGMNAAPESHEGRTPVIVELFTSEGCSDCPPAEVLATRLERTQPVPGAEILVLAEHMNYFNSARWSDRFSSAAFTNRQYGYASRFHGGYSARSHRSPPTGRRTVRCSAGRHRGRPARPYLRG